METYQYNGFEILATFEFETEEENGVIRRDMRILGTIHDRDIGKLIVKLLNKNSESEDKKYKKKRKKLEEKFQNRNPIVGW